MKRNSHTLLTCVCSIALFVCVSLVNGNTLHRGERSGDDLWSEHASVSVNGRERSSGRSLLGAVICDDGTDDDDDVVCCPENCGMGRCAADIGCTCITGWGHMNRNRHVRTCHEPLAEKWTQNAYLFLIVFFLMLWGIALLASCFALFKWFAADNKKLEALIGHGLLIFHALIRFLWLAIDPWGVDGIFPVFVDLWFNHLGFTLIATIFICAAMVLSRDIKASGGNPVPPQLPAPPQRNSMGLRIGCIAGVFCFLFLFQTASDGHAHRQLNEWIVLRIYVAIYFCLGILLGGGFGVKSYLDAKDQSNDNLTSTSYGVAASGIGYALLALFTFAFYYSDVVGEPKAFYRLQICTELFMLVSFFGALHAMRSPALAKMIYKEDESKFASSVHARVDPDEVDGGTSYKGVPRRGTLGSNDKAESQTVAIYFPETNTLDLSRTQNNDDEDERPLSPKERKKADAAKQPAARRNQSRPKINATSDTTRDW